MDARYIWRNCLLPEIKIPNEWRNRDVDGIEKRRQDLFLVEAPYREVPVMLPYIKDVIHKDWLEKSMDRVPGLPFKFLVSRDRMYVQYWPYFKVNTEGCQWKSLGNIQLSSLLDLGKL